MTAGTAKTARRRIQRQTSSWGRRMSPDAPPCLAATPSRRRSGGRGRGVRTVAPEAFPIETGERPGLQIRQLGVTAASASTVSAVESGLPERGRTDALQGVLDGPGTGQRDGNLRRRPQQGTAATCRRGRCGQVAMKRFRRCWR